MKKQSEGKLLKWMRVWCEGGETPGSQHEEEEAYKQIIKELEIAGKRGSRAGEKLRKITTNEWIEEKAVKFHKIAYGKFANCGYKCQMMKEIRKQVRSIVKEAMK